MGMNEAGGLSGRCERAEEKLSAAYGELVALREELAEARSDISTWRIHHDRKSVALDAAEQRNSVLDEELTSLTTRLNERDKLIDHIGSMIAKATAPNQKPTESGASE